MQKLCGSYCGRTFFNDASELRILNWLGPNLKSIILYLKCILIPKPENDAIPETLFVQAYFCHCPLLISYHVEHDRERITTIDTLIMQYNFG